MTTFFATSESNENGNNVYTNLDIGVTVETGVAVPFLSGGYRQQFSRNEAFKSKSVFYNSISSTIIRTHSLELP